MKNSICLFALLLLFGSLLQAQNSEKVFESRSMIYDLGIEFQAYPTGIIPAIFGEYGFNERNGLNWRVGANIFDHRDLGVQQEETGSGFGGSIGYRRYSRNTYSGWFGGIRADIWFNQVDWSNPVGVDPSPTSGVTDIVVLQPTVEAGFKWLAGATDRLSIAPHAAFGIEWNIVTDGEPTGEGLILLAGARLAYRIK